MKTGVKLVGGILFLLAWAIAAFGGVVVNEIMYHPNSTNVLEEWIELHNNGATNVNLSGWQFTRGVAFTFPTNTTIAVGGYLVVAADAATFTAKYPGVANVVPGSAGALDGHTLELDDGAGQTINRVTYYSAGDWAVRRMGPVLYDHQGWEWYTAHDGLGSSLELINPDLPNNYAHNWGSSTALHGTPGRLNSIAAANVPPFITGVAHAPVLPRPTDVVTVSARIVDEHTNGLTVTLSYRVDGAANFTVVPMFDDGTHGDGLAGDRIYAATLPAQPDSTVVEFFLQARDLENNLRTFPAFTPPTNSSRTANLLYQVDDGAYNGSQPIYRIIMTEAERAELFAIGRRCPDSDSDATMNATFITIDGVVTGGSTTQLRYNVGVRNRGHGTRQSNPNNYHLEIPADRKWKDQTGINLNSQYAHVQMLGSAIFRRLGVPMADSRAVQVRVNSTNLMAMVGGNSFGSYAANEQYNNDLVQRQFPLDDQGNSYRGIRQAVLCDPLFQNVVADLSWNGPNYSVAAYTNAYFKENHSVENDWSDLISLIGVLNLTDGTTAATYVADVQRVLNVDEWMKYMAINTLLDNGETCLANGYGDDYALYRGTNDTRFLALPYDLDTVMGRGTSPTSPRDGIFRMNALPVMDRFMKTPEFAPVYYRWLKSLADTTFSSAQMDPLLDQLLNGFVPQATIDTMKAFNASHVGYVVSQIPLALVVSNNLTINNGYPRTTSATVSLNGAANAIATRAVLVNGAAAAYVAWQGTWSSGSVALQPGINRLVVQTLGANGVEVDRTNYDVWYDDGSVQNVSGTLASDAIWTAAGGPYNVTANLIIPNGVTLTIQPGTTVYVASGVTITVNGTGKILSQGTESQHVHIGKNPAGTGNWGSLDFINSTVESRLAYVDFDSCGGTTIGGHNAQLHVNSAVVFIDHCTWPSTPVVEYISFDGSSFIVQGCTFPTYPPPTGPESLHGINGIRPGGYGIFRDNYFGHTWGFNDTIDFTGGNRPGPILQVINNVFDGASDDNLDLDSTDAWIEGNIFMHVHRDPRRTDDARDTGSAISGGVDFVGQNSDWTIINNIFYDVDHVFLNKGNSTTTGNGGGRVALLYNTVIHVAREGSGSPESDIAAFDWTDDGIALPDASLGSGLYAAHNIIYDCSVLNLHYDPAHHTVIMDNNILSVSWTGPGSSNQVVDPRLNLNVLEGTPVANVTAAQLRQACQLLPDSPAIGTGFGGRNIGALGPHGIAISGEPVGTNASTSATLAVGPGGTFNWGTATPQTWGWTAFKWKLDNGPWSGEIPVSNNSPFTNPAAINLSGLSTGPHTVYVTGKSDAGFYQDDTFVYPTNAGIAAQVTASRTWTVDTSYVPSAKPTIRINEVLAKNIATFNNGGTFPDMIELYNYGNVLVDLVDMSLSDSASAPRKFVFPPGTASLAPGAYLVLYADSVSAAPGIHLGFSLKQSGDDVSLYDKAASGGALIDSVNFGIQLDDYSIGRMPDGAWTMCKPTFGAANANAALSDFHHLKINEWLADAQFAANNDFLELYNPGVSPSALGGLFLSDAAGAPTKNPISPLSFIAGSGFTSFVADGDAGQGADHLNFKLPPDVGLILLSAPDLTVIDAINYGPQQTDVSQGRSPSGSDTLTSFAQPTSGGPNPGLAGVVSVTNVTQTAVQLLNLTGSSWRYNNSGVDPGTTWRAASYNDSAWTSGFGLFGFETTPQIYPYPFQTTIPAPDQANGRNTVYYRTHFQWNGGLTSFSLVSTNYVDDGAVYYLNGVEVGRLRIAAGAVTYTTAAAIAPEPAFDILTFSTNALVAGDNVMAVEVHQVSCCGAGTSSDDVFGMSLSAIHYTTNIITQTFGVPLVLNEVFGRNQMLTNFNGHTADFIEIFNPSTNAIDVSDLSLSNDPDQPRKFVFPLNTSIGPLGYLLVYCDDTSPVSGTNTGFGLGAKGDAVFFFHRPSAGGALLDGISFGLQTPDVSIGRVPNGSGNWTLTTPTPSAPNSAAGLGSVASLKVNEWLADPVSGGDWFEIYNSGNQPVALGGLFLTDDLTDKTQSPVPPLSFIGTGGNAFIQFMADGNQNAGADHVKFSLKKSGEAVAIYSPAQVLIDAVSFGQQQTGVSQGRFPDGSVNIVNFAQTVSPAESNFLPLPNVVVNEVLTHTDPPLEDAIEFYNPSASAVNIGGWYLSNSQDDLKKYRITDGTSIPAGGFKVFYEFQFNSTDGSSVPFTLNSAHGDAVYLSQADAGGNLSGYRAAAKFGAAANRVSFGRYTNSVGTAEFVAMSARSFGADNPSTVAQFRTGAGAANPYPVVGPVVVNEIMYQPAGVSGSLIDENTAEEFIELRNITASSVPLYDPAATTNTWKIDGGVSFTFPQNVTLPAGAYVLLVNFDPVANADSLAAFRSKYGVSTSVPIYGPYGGNLNNTGESIQLFKPDPPQLPPHPDAGFVPYVLIEQINYSALSPWATNAAATGNSLQRKVGSNFGDDPANWLAAPPTAGANNAVNTPGDTDGDGLPDAWELQYFPSISDPDATPNADPDGDGFTNLQEYLAGTNPLDGSSSLSIEAVTVGGNETALEFDAIAGKTYSVLYSERLSTGTWLRLTNVPPPAVSGVVTVNDPTTGGVPTRFYRVVTPAQP